MEHTTKRLILRHWTEDDAENLYQYAKDPKVGPIAGWQPHTSIENSREIIKTVLSDPETYAICLKENNQAIGSIGLCNGNNGSIENLSAEEAELGYWIGVPYWGLGMTPEAALYLIRYAFEELSLKRLWCGYFDGNLQSKRVQEKCSFEFQYIILDKYCPLIQAHKIEHISSLTKEQWQTINEASKKSI